MILLPPDLKEFLRLLHSNGVEYLLVGGYAVGYYGYPRATGDMDVWIARTAENAEKVTVALTAFGFGEASVSPELFTTPNRVFRMGNPPLRIELLTGISGVEFADCWQRRIIFNVDGISINIIDLDDLKQNKRASGRMKDKNDIANLP